MKSPDSNGRVLVDAWYDGTITPEQLIELEARLETDANFQSFFFQIAELDGSLPYCDLPKLVVKKAGFTRLSRLMAVAAVYILGIFCGFMLWKRSRLEPVATTLPVATVTSMLGVSISDANRLHAIKPHEKISVDSGLIELTFARGARAIVEAPAIFQLVDDNSMIFHQGKMVAEVPKQAIGFSVRYVDGEIIDVGTEFALEVPNGAKRPNLGVFRGEIHFHPNGHEEKVIKLLENYAITSEGNEILSIPFNRANFTRAMPSRQFSWSTTGGSQNSSVWDFDVSHLVWSAGEFRAVVKWMRGEGILKIHRAELLRDGVIVNVDEHLGTTGKIVDTNDNTYTFKVNSTEYVRGVWKLRLYASSAKSDSQINEDLTGLLLFEEDIAVHAQRNDFFGTWEYMHNGIKFHRIFLEDGTARLLYDGRESPLYVDSKWRCENGQLFLDVNDGNGGRALEIHTLRNHDTFVFVNQPYENAKKVVNYSGK